MNLFELFVKLGVKDEASSQISNLSTKLKTGLATAAKVGTAAVAAVGTAAVAAGKQIWDLANKTAQYGDEIDKNSQRVGLSYEAYQKWDYAMQISGASIDSTMIGLKTLTNTFDDANNGTASAIEKFSRLGLSMEQLQGLSREDLFEEVVFALSRVSDETEKAALANDLFGRSGQELMPMFNTTEEGLRGLLDEAENYGTIMSDDAVKASAAFQDSLTRLSSAFKGAQNDIVSTLLPSLTQVIEGLAKVVSGSDDAGAQIKEGVSGLVKDLKDLLPRFLEVITSIASAVLENAPDIIFALITGVVDAVPKLISSIGEAISHTISAVSAFFRSPEQMQTLMQSGESILQNVIDGITGALDWLYDSADDIIEWISTGISNAVDGLFGAATNILTTLGDFLLDEEAMTDLGVSAGQIVGKIGKFIIDTAVDIWDAGVEMLNQLGAYFNGNGSSAGEKFDAMGENILTAIGKAIEAAWGEMKPSLDKIVENMQDFFENIDWELTTKDLMSDFFESLVRKSVKSEYELKELWNNLRNWFLGMDWEAVGQSILDAVLNFLTFGIYGWVSGKNGDAVSKALSGAGQGIADVAGRADEIRENEIANLERKRQQEVTEAVSQALAQQNAQTAQPWYAAPTITNNFYAQSSIPSEQLADWAYQQQLAGIH